MIKHGTRVELCIDRGKGAEEENKAIFDQLIAAKAEVETAFGSELEWRNQEGTRCCRILKQITEGGWRDDEDKWPTIHEIMVDTMIRLEAALRPHVQKLKV